MIIIKKLSLSKSTVAFGERRNTNDLLNMHARDYGPGFDVDFKSF